MTKEFLRTLDPNISEMLPDGAKKQLAKEFGKAPWSITRILRGDFGSNEEVLKIYARAKQIIHNESVLFGEAFEWLTEQEKEYQSVATP